MGFTREDLKKVDESLREMADEKYREFHSRLIPGVKSIFYGVRVPALRKLARQLVKGDWRGFVELTKDSSVSVVWYVPWRSVISRKSWNMWRSLSLPSITGRCVISSAGT